MHTYTHIICNSYITGAGIYCTEAREREAARGLSAINAMHPKCAWYNYFISCGHSYYGYVQKTINFEKEEISVPHTKQPHKAALRVSSGMSIKPWVKILIQGCGQIHIAWIVLLVAQLTFSLCNSYRLSIVLVVELGCQETNIKARAKVAM